MDVEDRTIFIATLAFSPVTYAQRDMGRHIFTLNMSVNTAAVWERLN